MKSKGKKKKAIAIILGGGRGTRLYPLTMDRSKPAVPFAGKYRLVDIPISNCLNSGINQIYVLTQFNTASLHNHIVNTYQFDQFSGGFVEILAAEQTYRRKRTESKMASSVDWCGFSDSRLLYFHYHQRASESHRAVFCSSSSGYCRHLLPVYHRKHSSVKTAET